MAQITTLIVDDEPLARKRLKSLLEEDEDIEIVAICENGKEAIEQIEELRPDLLYLDIQMPEVDGFDVLEQMPQDYQPVTVFVTAYDEYAVNAFEKHALDYVLKPFDKKRFQKSLRRAKDYLDKQGDEAKDKRLEQMVNDLHKSQGYLERLMIKQTDKIIFVKTEDIDWIEAAGNYVQLHIDDKSYITRSTMSNMEERLDPNQFFRIHRSTIVNLDSVKEIEPWFHGDYKVQLHNGEELTLSRNYKEILQKFSS